MQLVVLGADSPIGLALIRDLGRSGYAVTALGRKMSALGLVSRYCRTPLKRAADGEPLIAQLLELAAAGQPAALLAISETDIAMLNRWREPLAQRYNLLFADATQMAQVLDKRLTQQQADSVGIATATSWQLQTLAELEAVAPQLQFPLILKWANPHQVSALLHGAGLTLHKIQYCRDLAELTACLTPYQAIGHFPLIQRYYAGHGLGQFFLCREGEALVCFQHERVHEWPPEGGSASLCKTAGNHLHQACAERSKALLKRLNWQGVAMVEYRYDPATAHYVLMEINGRFWGSTPLSLCAGANFASNLVKALALQQTITQPQIKARYCRYMIPELKRLWRIVVQPGLIKDPQCHFNKAAEIAAFVGYFFHPRCRYYVFAWDDPAPFFADLTQALNKSGNALLRALRLQKLGNKS
ncbi:carboxylate--amine ligase [Rheinheimera sp. NSM]|uniref:carboxylate--amine ligase n=1 Tax=Rheinheimera sp. NSM TaxID=3457884 RepID=UPI00403550E3